MTELSEDRNEFIAREIGSKVAGQVKLSRYRESQSSTLPTPYMQKIGNGHDQSGAVFVGRDTVRKSRSIRERDVFTKMPRHRIV
jgi:hypothetical protein